MNGGMPETFDYFAYGSNMLPERLQARCPSAELLGRAYVKGHKVSFAKRSIDGSGKATIEIATDPNSTVHGVLFRIGIDELGSLDTAEGAGNGYNRCDKYSVIDADGAVVEAVTYIADSSAIDPNLAPYDWYRDLVVAGAIE
ncbi:MAG: gamma-glutamylcyclotransferase family protein, partial [Alphaproteobacteria bacterium]